MDIKKFGLFNNHKVEAPKEADAAEKIDNNKNNANDHKVGDVSKVQQDAQRIEENKLVAYDFDLDN